MFNLAKINLEKVRVGLLTAGAMIATSSVVAAFYRFYGSEGTIFKIKDCAIPNPITTPCFWGALAFIFATVWAYNSLYKKTNGKKFLYFLIFCVIFAWSNFYIELEEVSVPKGSLLAPCPATTQNPYTSPCFAGSVLFTLSALTTLFILKVKEKKVK
jgi:hypothetical protein